MDCVVCGFVVVGTLIGFLSEILVVGRRACDVGCDTSEVFSFTFGWAVVSRRIVEAVGNPINLETADVASIVAVVVVGGEMDELRSFRDSVLVVIVGVEDRNEVDGLALYVELF